MSRSKTLYQVQEFDTQIDNAKRRIREINTLLADNKLLDDALKIQSSAEAVYTAKKKLLSSAEVVVEDHSVKIEQNQKKLYSGSVTNHKELADLQQESESLNKYLAVLEERQLEAMLEMEEAQKEFQAAADKASSIKSNKESEHADLNSEKDNLEHSISLAETKKESFLASNDIPDLQIYQSLRESSGGIAVTIMIANSCSSCGANIPSAIAQEGRSPGKLAFCPTCKRILHPG